MSQMIDPGELCRCGHPYKDHDTDLTQCWGNECPCQMFRFDDRIPLCGLCGGPHGFDTSIESVLWNRVIRDRGLPELLCLSCIVVEFTKAGESFTATLWGSEFNGTSIHIQMVTE